MKPKRMAMNRLPSLAHPNTAAPIAAALARLTPPVFLGVDDVVILIDVEPNVRRIGMSLFHPPAIAFIVANNGC